MKLQQTLLLWEKKEVLLLIIMVLEHLFPENWLEKKARYAFIIAVIYSTVGIFVSRVLFGANSGIVSVFFASILMMPYLKKFFRKEGRNEEIKKDDSIGSLIKHTLPMLKIYICLFLGVYLTYNLYSFALPLAGYDPNPFFREQLMLDSAVRGQAASISIYGHILSYNWWVLLACFLLALIAGDGAIFFIVWNASSWGALMGYRAVTAAFEAGANPWWFLVLVLGITFTHMILEGVSYILAAISGSVISNEVIKKAKEVKMFIISCLSIALIFWVFYTIYGALFGTHSSMLFTILSMIVITLLISLLSDVFRESRHKAVFTYNFRLFVISILVLTVAALIESYVLSYSHILNEIYTLSIMHHV